ncbi:MMPL family transporter [Ekhidna sp.]|jgi:predicted RND superfamily exporter protein|uniref:efflux RND transporter permease subunit n=1 Tax=Ekhidna sp. TaxID=2608089 RepID=UPI0032EC9CE9
MWSTLAHTILRFRVTLMVILALVTVFMGYKSQNIKWSYDLANIVPESDPDMVYFRQFRETFGEDGNIMAIGVRDSSIYQLETFKKFSDLTFELEQMEGIRNVLGLPNLQKLEKNNQKRAFELQPVFETIPDNQEELDSLLQGAASLKFYSGQLINSDNGATLILITIKKEVLNSKNRDQLVNNIIDAGKRFEEASGVDVHFAGLPYSRSITTSKVKAELNMFLVLSLVVTGIILFLFFRSFKAVFFPLVIIGVVVIWVMGTLALLEYKITLLTGLIPPIIVVIGIPNSVYMLNRYHHEFSQHGDQMKALSRIIRKIGVVTFITNLTTAVGFFVLATTQINVLVEFGIVAGINIMATFVVSIILIPGVFSLYKPPTQKHLKHLKFKMLDSVIRWLDDIVHELRPAIFAITIAVAAVSAYGLSQIKAVSYMVDDIPENSPLKKDLHFFEQNFSGIMPLEIIVDTGAKKGVQNLRNLRKIDEFESFISSIDYISQPVSVVSFAKAARQAFYNQSPAFYSLPTNRDMAFIMRYLSEGETEDISQSFVDSTSRYLRVSLKIADIGSNRLDSLVNGVIAPKIDSIFVDSKMDVNLTGTTLMFIKGNKFLIENLLTSMMIAFFIIALIMGLLFRNIKMIIISIIPNIIPLLVTAGIMGYFGIPLKPSTALIFSIVFGISVDDSIHFLAKYRQELFAHKFDVSKAISKSIRETGSSMIYTSIILFFGFIIFVLSEFGGTIALGKLTSITLFFAMITNVVVLPALILQFDSGKRDKSKHPLIESVPELAEGIDDDESNKKNKKSS